LALARFFLPGFAIKKSSRFLPALISRASHPAVPPLPLQVSPVLGFIDIAAHREQLGYGKVFYIGRWHYALRMKISVSFIKPFGTQLQHPEVE
jgi:hypothetical protein